MGTANGFTEIIFSNLTDICVLTVHQGIQLYEPYLVWKTFGTCVKLFLLLFDHFVECLLNLSKIFESFSHDACQVSVQSVHRNSFNLPEKLEHDAKC